jgi:hypothetical protein
VARSGGFIGPQSEAYGAPLSVVKPIDNNATASQYHQSLMDPALGLTREQMDERQREILELYRLLQIARDLPPGQGGS